MALSEPPIPINQTPIVVVARGILSFDRAVQSVTILREGRILAHENVETRDYGDYASGEEFQLTYFSSSSGILVSVRLDRLTVDDEIGTGIERMLNFAYSVMTP